MVASLANAATTFHEEAMMKNLASIRETLAGIDAPADLCGGVTCSGCEGSPAPENSPCAVCGLYAKPQQPAVATEAKAIIDELNASYLYGVSEKSDNLAKRIIAALSPLVDRPPTTSSVVDREGGDNGYQSDVAVAAKAITETGLLDGDEAMSAARAALSTMPTPDAIRAETTARVVAWLRGQRIDVPAHGWEFAEALEHGHHLTGGGE